MADKKKNVVLLVLLIIITGTILIIAGRSIATDDSSALRDQEVETLEFRNANIEYQEGISKFTVEVENTGEAMNLRYINIDIKDEDDSVTRLIGYLGDTLNTNDMKVIVASIDKDISNPIDITYSIEK